MDEDKALEERIRAMAADGESQPVLIGAPSTDYLNGAFQNALALGNSYLSRRIDIDLQGRVTGYQPTVYRSSNQRPVADHADLTTRAVASAGGMRIGDMLPWLAAAGLVYLVLSRAG